MKKLCSLSVLVISLFVSAIIGLFVAVNIHAYDPSEKEEIYGTWINPEYGEMESYRPQKLIMNPDGTWKRFRSRHDLSTPYIGTFTLTDKWTDSDGNIWYKQIWKYKTIETIYEIVRISNSGKTLEHIWSKYDFPKGITADHPNYRIFFRQ